MRPNAIVYTSNTGYTAEYAAMLAKHTSLPVYSLKEAAERLPAGNSIIYMGWLMAGTVKDYKKAARMYHIQALCGVGMGATGSQMQDLKNANALPDNLPVFTLQGGFDLHRLRGIYRLMMVVMSKTLGRKLSEKPDRTPEEDSMLKLLTHGGSCVCEENLAAVLEWYRSI